MVVSNRFKQGICMAFALLAVSSGFGVVTVFDSNSVIAEGDTYDQVLIKGDRTVVTMTGGTVGSLATVGGSKFILTGATNAFLSAYDDSTMEISGDVNRELYAYGNSSILIADSADVRGIYIKGTSQLTISGVSASVGYIALYHNSHMTFVSGSVGEIYPYGDCRIEIEGGTVTTCIQASGSCPVVRISGGHIERVEWRDCGGLLSVSGGTIAYLSSFFYIDDYLPCGTPSFAIIGHDLEASPYGGNHNSGQITGFWNDDTSFTIDLAEGDAFAWLTLYDGVIPQDCVSRPDSDLNNDCVVNLDDLNKLASEWLDDGTQ